VNRGHWEGVAPEWIDWARAPGHDAFWAYREALLAFLPEPGRVTLDLGCGEGRVARELTALGHTVTAAGYAPTLLAPARQAGSACDYAAAFEAAGLAVVTLTEPVPDVERFLDMTQWARVPMFVWLNLRPLS
jgi:SAM-dependent methyltransferase